MRQSLNPDVTAFGHTAVLAEQAVVLAAVLTLGQQKAAAICTWLVALALLFPLRRSEAQ